MIINNEFFLKFSKDNFKNFADAVCKFYNETNRLYDMGYMNDNNPMVLAVDDFVRHMDYLIDPTGVQPWFTRWIWGAQYGAELGSGCTVMYKEGIDKEDEYFNDVGKYYDFMIQHLNDSSISDDI